MKNHQFFLGILIIGLLVNSSCSSLDAGRYPNTNGGFQESGNYLINPETILESLNMGDLDVFVPMLATPGPNDILLPPGSFAWTQSDYVKIANALSQQVWKETLEGWNIYYLVFDSECQDNPHGFDSLEITYYKTIEVNSESVYTARLIDISPLASQVSWGGGSNFPRPVLGGWNNIDLTKSKITAEEALQIAEVNGGKEARSIVKNDCRILIRAPQNNNSDSWDVYYYPNINFEVLIDPYTGKYKIVH